MAEQRQRAAPRFHLIARVDIMMADRAEPIWGAVGNISRTGVALYVREPLKPSGKTTLRFRFQADGGREITEDLTATIVWQRGETAGLEFEAPLIADSATAVQAPNLAAHIAKNEAAALWPL
ncbi:MAG: PilZ domain-containing protein [Nitrospirae bacterium]|nr:MAG: PilZ domain-containing protein [Nitrospirota bacterium]